MKMKYRFLTSLAGALLASGIVLAGETPSRQDAKAMEVLHSMSAYTATLDRVLIEGVTLTDARLGGGLMVSNSTEVKVSIDRPGSLHINSFDGVASKDIFIHNEALTVFNSERNFYAQASVPAEIDEAMDFALEEMDIEAPLMDLIHRDSKASFLGPDETVLYLTDKARIAGVDCHHIAIRGSEIDVQIWVEEGDKPMPRQIMITSKWEGGAPRHIANLAWITDPEFAPGTFEFKAPEGAIKIEFFNSSGQGGK